MRALLFAIASAFLLSSVPSRAADSVESDLKNLIDKFNAKLEGSEVTEAVLAPEFKEFDAIVARHREADREELAEVLATKAMAYMQLFGDAPKAIEIFNQIKTAYPGTKPAETADEIVAKLRNQENGAKRLADAEKIQAELKVGSTFPNFKVLDLAGKPLSISALRGKVVLVDFWATWCMPCLMELPNVLAAYDKYHSQGFDVIGINLDQDKAALNGFLKKYGVPWPQYFDGKLFDNELAVKYGILGIPATFLLDKKGRILAKDLRGEELDETIAKALGKN